MSKHTPGPWHVGDRAGYNACQIYALIPGQDHPPAICQMYGLPMNLALDQIEPERYPASLANAHLIAAAPAMYEALKNFNFSIPPDDAPCHRDLCSQDECPNCQREIAAVKALAQAEGRQS